MPNAISLMLILPGFRLYKVPLDPKVWERAATFAMCQAGSTVPVTKASAVAPLVLHTLCVHPLGR